MAERDFYALLGVPRTATADEIKKAYRKLARELHPDRNPDNKPAEERFKDVSYANDILSDPERRAAYDEFGEVGLKEGFNANAARQYKQWQSTGARPGNASGNFSRNFQDIFGQGSEGGFNFNLDDLLGGRNIDDVLGGKGRGARRPTRGTDQLSEVRIAFGEALRGCEKEFIFRRPNAEDKSVRVRIPAGVHDGGKVRLRGQGQPGVDGGEPGDLVLTVHVDAHPNFRREGNDLHLNLPITIVEAWRGGKVRVPTIEGEVQLTVPAKTQGGAVLRLRGKGVHPKGHEPGDMYVHFEIQLPQAATDETDHAIDELTKAYSTDVRADVRL